MIKRMLRHIKNLISPPPPEPYNVFEEAIVKFSQELREGKYNTFYKDIVGNPFDTSREIQLRVVGSGLFDNMEMCFPEERTDWMGITYWGVTFRNAPFNVEARVRWELIKELGKACTAYLDFVADKRFQQTKKIVQNYVEGDGNEQIDDRT